MKCANGSALVVTILVLAVLTIVTTSSWYTASLFLDAALLRQKTVQQTQALQGLLDYAAALVVDTFDVYLTIEGTRTLYKGTWPCAAPGSYQGLATVTAQGKQLVVQARLSSGAQAIATRACCLQRDTTAEQKVWMYAWNTHKPSA